MDHGSSTHILSWTILATSIAVIRKSICETHIVHFLVKWYGCWKKREYLVRKVFFGHHRFDVDVPGGPVLQESKFTASGMRYTCVTSFFCACMCLKVFLMWNCFWVLHFIPVSVIGSNLVVSDSPIGKLGLSVCYDLRFPEMYQQLRFKKHAEVFFCAFHSDFFMQVSFI